MGDYYQIIVVKDVSAEDAPRLAGQLRDWLVAKRIIEPELTDCTLGGPGHRPGPEHARALESAEFEVPRLWTNGFQIETGRTVFHTISGQLTCRACGARFEPQGGWFDAVSVWYEGDDDVTFACPECGKPERLTEWDGEWPWGFGNLGFTFWNWPRLSERFVHEASEQLGRQTLVVRGKL